MKVHVYLDSYLMLSGFVIVVKIIVQLDNSCLALVKGCRVKPVKPIDTRECHAEYTKNKTQLNL